MQNTSRNWKGAAARMASPAVAILLTLIVAGCETTKTITPLQRDLPEKPSGLSGEVPAPPLYGDARAVLAETRTALKEANAKNVCGDEWYASVRDFYRGVRTEEPSADGIECLKEKLPEPPPKKAKRTKRKAKR